MENKRLSAKSVEDLRFVLMGSERLTAKSVEALLFVLMEKKRNDAKPAKLPAHMLKKCINAKKVAMCLGLKEN